MDSANGQTFDWRTAKYQEWNRLLVEYCLGSRRHGPVVSHIPASPEELCEAAGADAEFLSDVTDAFIACVRHELPRGVAFCGYCSNGNWSPESREPPHFFGMLWFTCLLASGHPDGRGSFSDKFEKYVQKSVEDFRCLNDLWDDVATWCEASPGYSRLHLPPVDGVGVRTSIGRSYFLAFPIREDRKALEEVLGEADILGIEPPLVPVIAALEREKDRFSDPFVEEFERFLAEIEAGRDPTEGPFWRAIRAETVGSSATVEVEQPKTRETTILASWDDDETLLLRVAVPDSVRVADLELRPLAVPLGATTHYICDTDGDVDDVVESLLRGTIELAGGLGALIRQGVLVFGSDVAGDRWLAWGEEADGSNLALVRADRREAFVHAFGGRASESRFDGWFEVEGCRVQQLAHLPAGLTGATQLLYTTRVPRPHFVGGVRLGVGYLWNRTFKPRIRSPSAAEVSCGVGDALHACTRGAYPDDDWLLPSALRVVPPAVVRVRATFSIDLDGRILQRHSETTLAFVARGSGLAYKRTGAGEYWREGGRPAESTHSGSSDVPLDITTGEAIASGDMQETEPSIRYLGPGLGEMSRTPRPGFVWQASGTRNAPHDLVFVGDLDSPVLPDGGQSTDKGDRRTWKYAFGGRSTRVTARIGKSYVPLASEPRLKQVLGSYRVRAQRRDIEVSRTFGPAEIDECWASETSSPGDEQAQEAVEVVAALALARSGLPLRDFQDVLTTLIGRDDYLLRQQVVRAWEEAGVIDVLRRKDRSQTLVVPRVPRLVTVTRGPSAEARLIGLATGTLVAAIKAVVGTERVSWRRPTTVFQPAGLRLTSLEAGEAELVSQRVGLPEPERLLWRDPAGVPAHVRITDDYTGLSPGKPPDAYSFDAHWDWSENVFKQYRPGGNPDLVTVERRRHPDRCSIYVILVDGDEMLWCHTRTWALLRATELWDRPGFRVSVDGEVASAGRSPIHLPLPFGRLCAVLGSGLPGPDLNEAGSVRGYRYPYGTAVCAMIRPAMPSIWTVDQKKE